MDGFRDRLTGRAGKERGSVRSDRYDDRYEDDSEEMYDRVSTDRYDRDSDDRYDRMSQDRYDRMGSDRYDRYERNRGRRNSEGLSADAISSMIEESNRSQLDAITDMFEDAKVDRLESERAIISALSDKKSQTKDSSGSDNAKDENTNKDSDVLVTKLDESSAKTLEALSANSEVLSRVERLAGANAESLNENSEMLERSVNSLRENTELINDIRGGIAGLAAGQQELKEAAISSMNRSDASACVPVSFNEEKEEILSSLSDNRSLLNMIRQDILANAKPVSYEDDAEPKEENLSAAAADKYYKDLEDHVHKECVKCYRNVQSALTEQNAETLKGTDKSVSGVKILATVSLVFSAITLVGVAAICYLLIFGGGV